MGNSVVLKPQEKIFELLGSQDKARFSEIRRELKISVGAVYHHINRLMELGILEKNGNHKYGLTAQGKHLQWYLRKQENAFVLGIVTGVAVTCGAVLIAFGVLSVNWLFILMGALCAAGSILLSPRKPSEQRNERFLREIFKNNFVNQTGTLRNEGSMKTDEAEEPHRQQPAHLKEQVEEGEKG